MTKLQISFFLLINFIICQPGLAQKNEQTHLVLPVIDKEAKYPEKTLEANTETKYIFLETRKDILLDQGAHVFYLSDKRILIANKLKGDVFLFDISGKAISHFNQKGGLGYAFLSYTSYDEPNKEIFVLDHISRKICVFSETGALIRTLHLPSKMCIKEIYNFDENTLLAFHEHQYGELTQKKPYLFISKKDGKILSELNITTEKVNPAMLKVGNMSFAQANNYSGSCKFGNDFILSNRSSDTIFILNQNKKLTPLFVQKPSVFSDPPKITCVGMKTDDFVEFSVFPYDLKESRRKYENGEKPPISDPDLRFLLYEIKTNQFFEIKNWRYWNEKIDIPKNMEIELMEPYLLKEWLQKGYLKGEIKKIAEKVGITDNPVLRVTKFKAITIK